MKTYLFIVAFSSLFTLTASAQNDRNLRNDHTYSTHNYKHANKAAKAGSWKDQAGVAVRAPGFSQGLIANYKHSVSDNRPAGGVTLPHTPDMDVAVRNYKSHQANIIRTTSQPAFTVIEQSPVQPNVGGN